MIDERNKRIEQELIDKQYALFHGNAHLSKSILQSGINPNIYELDNRNTPLHFAVFHNDFEKVTVLLSYGANVNARNNFGATALHWAVDKHNEKMVTYLLDKGADINIENTRGFTPLRCAMREGLPDIEKLLIKYGAMALSQKGNDDHTKNQSSKSVELSEELKQFRSKLAVQRNKSIIHNMHM